jgi:hypothetical protein
MATRTACACCRGWPTSSHHDQRSVRLRNRQCALTSRSEKYSLALAAPSSVSPHIRITHPPLPRERSAPSLPSIFPPPVPVLSHYLLSPSPLPPPPPPLPPFALSALLALRGPALQQSPRPGSSLPSPASPCLWPAWLTTISPVAPIHLQHRHTHTHTHTHQTHPRTTPQNILGPHLHPRTTLQAASGQVSVGSTIRITPRQHFPLQSAHLHIAHVIRLARAQTVELSTTTTSTP